MEAVAGRSRDVFSLRSFLGPVVISVVIWWGVSGGAGKAGGMRQSEDLTNEKHVSVPRE